MHNIVHRILILVVIIVSFVKADEESALAVKKSSKFNLKNRHGRTTYVKAILSNPKLSSTHILAEKLAKETLRSPRTQGRLKKLTEVSSHVENRRADSSDPPKKHHKKRKRKKHKHRLKKHRRRHGHRRKHGHRKNEKKHLVKKQVLGNFDGTKGAAYLTKKIQVKRNDIDCTINKSDFVNPARHALPISEPFYPETSGHIRISRQVPNNLSNRNLRVLPLVDGDGNPLVYIPDDNLPEDPTNTMGVYSLERQLNFIPQMQENIKRPLLFSPRLSHLTKNDVISENPTPNCTTGMPTVSLEVTKNEEPTKSEEPTKAIEYLSTSSTSPEKTPEYQQVGNLTRSETKQVANEILNEIIEELQDFKMDHNSGNLKEGLPCKIAGTWVPVQAGVKLRIKVANHTLFVTLEKMSPTEKIHSGIIDTMWNISGHMPYKRGAPFSLIATNGYMKSLATFVGACRVCEGIDTIQGVWSLIREAKNCRNLQASISIYYDTLRRVSPNPKSESKTKVS